MRESALRIKDKTYVICGTFNTIVQSITTTMTEHGADIAIVDTQSDFAQRFCRNIMDQREISDNFGRCIFIEGNINSEDSAEQLISKAAESFGSIDGVIDTHLLTTPTLWNKELNDDDKKKWDTQYEKMQFTTQSYLKFINGRKKGNCTILFNELDEAIFKDLDTPSIKEHIKEISQSVNQITASINGLALGCSEEYLLKKVGENLTVQQALEEIKSQHPQARVVDNQHIANIVTYFSSPLCSGLSGQTVAVNNASL